MKRFLSLGAVLALCLVGVRQAQAGTVYSNGPINGSVSAWDISFGYAVSDSFTVSSPTGLSSVTAGLWTYAGETPASLSWSIGTSPNGSDISSGTATLTNSYYGGGFGDPTFASVWSSSFAIDGTILSPGTYYLTLSNASWNGTSNIGDGVYWDENDGPSQAYQFYNGSQVATPSGSESFTISSPEPASLTLLGLGVCGLAGYGWRRRKAAAV